MDKKEKIFPQGLIFKLPPDNAPEWVRGKISVKVEEFTEFCNNHANNGWVNIDLKKSKEGKLYLELDTYQKKSKEDSF